MSLSVRGSDSLYWRAGIDTDNLQRDANKVSSIMRTVGTLITGYMVRDVAKAALEQDRALTKVAAAYKQLGIYSGNLMRDTEKLAQKMQDLANVEDDIVAANISVMAVIGKLRADQIEPATKAAIGLAKAYGLDVASAFNLVGRAAAGHTETLARYGIVLKEGATGQEKFDELMQKGAEGFETAKRQAADATGQYEKFKNSIGDLKESIGAFAATDFMQNRIKTLTDNVKSVTDWVTNLGLVFDLVGNKAQKFWVNLSYYIKSGGLYATPGVKDMADLQEKLLVERNQNITQLEKRFESLIAENQKKISGKWDSVAGAVPVVPGLITTPEMTEEQKKSLDEILKATMTTDQKIAEVHKMANDLIMASDNEVHKNRIRIWEQQQTRELKGLANPFASIGGTKASFVEYEFAAKEFADKLAAKSADLDKRIAESSVEIKRGSLDEILKDTRGMNSKELIEYAKFLQKKAELYSDDKELRLKLLDEATEAINKSYELEIKKIQEIGNAFNALGNLVGQFDSKLGGSISQISNIISSIVEMKNATSGWGQLSGILGMFGSVASIMQSLFGGGNAITLQQSLEETNKQIERLVKSLERATGLDVLKNLKEQESIYINQLLALEAQLATYQRLYKVHPLIYGGKIKEVQDAITDVSDELSGLKIQIQDTITGTTAESIADSITEGFAEGLGTAEIFADNFESLMRNAILNAFKAQIMSEALKPWYESFAELSKEGLTPQEIQQLGIRLGQDLTWMRGLFQGAEEIMQAAGLNLIDTTAAANKTGLAGAIAGVSEQTAGLLAGQFNAVRINVVEHLAVTRQMKDYTSVIMATALDNLKANQETAMNTRYLRNINALLESGSGVRAIGI